MFKRLTLVGLLAALAAGSALAQTDFAAFRAPLSSSSENPPVDDVDVAGSALVLIQLNRDSSDEISNAVVGFYADLDSDDAVTITNMHIHRGGSSDNGPVVIDSLFGSSVDLESGASQIFRQNTVTSEEELAVIEELMDDPSDFYVNLHSSDNPDGVTRGQLQVAAFDDDGPQGPSNSQLFTRLNVIEETVARIARRIGVVPATEDDVDSGNGNGNENDNEDDQ